MPTMRTMRTTRRRARAAAALALAAVTALGLLAGCGDGGDEREGTQPAPGVTTFEQGAFDDLPLAPGSRPAGPRSEKDGVVARSYLATTLTPSGVLDFYRQALDPGWELIDAPHPVGETAVRGRWASGDSILVVSATDPGAIAGGGDTVVQYSLSLEPRG